MENFNIAKFKKGQDFSTSEILTIIDPIFQFSVEF